MKTSITLLLLIVSAGSFAQSLTLEKELHEIWSGNKVDEVTNTDNYFYLPYWQSGKIALENYIAKYPENPYRFVAMGYLAEIFEKFNLVDSSVLYYKQVLTMPDNVDRNNFHRYGAAFQLTKIFLDRRDYTTALNYLEQAAGPFFVKPVSNCGGVTFVELQRIDVLYWKCYFGLGYYKQAIDRFAGYMFYDYGNDPQKLYDAYVKVYSKEEIKNEFLEASHKIAIKKEPYDSNFRLQPVFKIFDKEIKLYANNEFEKLTEEEQLQKCIEKIRMSKIYTLATQP